MSRSNDYHHHDNHHHDHPHDLTCCEMLHNLPDTTLRALPSARTQLGKKFNRYCGRRRNCQLLLVLLTAVVLITLTLYKLMQWSSLSGDGGDKGPVASSLRSGSVGAGDAAVVCPEISALRRKQLFSLLSVCSALLQRLHITHFLCYTSLWAAAQESGPFPWDANAQLCALNALGLGYDEPSLLRAFRKAGLSLDYSSADAVYMVTNASLPEGSPHVQVTLFEEDPRLGPAGLYRRVGWKRRLLPPNCDTHTSLHCFPASLVALPLPNRTFGPLSLPTPRENIDLLKFHYPDTWYKPVQARC